MTVLDVSRHHPRPMSDYELMLDDQEAELLLRLAQELAQVPPRLLDDAQYLDAARRLSCRVPLRMREVLRRFRHDPGEDGAVLVSGLPVFAEDLPQTPTVAGSVERTTSVHAALLLLAGLQLGEIVAYHEEKSGALVQNLLPVAKLAHSQSNAGSVPLEYHVENAFHPYRPDYVGLLCLRSDHQEVAATTVSSIRRALPLLDDLDVEVLREPRFHTAAPPSFRTAARLARHPVLDGSPEDPNICCDFNATTALDAHASEVLQRLRTQLEKVEIAPVLRPGQLVFVDNRVTVHGRTRFTPRYDGTDRWLHRVYVHLDNRRSRRHRTGNGTVMVSELPSDDLRPSLP